MRHILQRKTTVPYLINTLKTRHIEWRETANDLAGEYSRYKADQWNDSQHVFALRTRWTSWLQTTHEQKQALLITKRTLTVDSMAIALLYWEHHISRAHTFWMQRCQDMNQFYAHKQVACARELHQLQRQLDRLALRDPL